MVSNALIEPVKTPSGTLKSCFLIRRISNHNVAIWVVVTTVDGSNEMRDEATSGTQGDETTTITTNNSGIREKDVNRSIILTTLRTTVTLLKKNFLIEETIDETKQVIMEDGTVLRTMENIGMTIGGIIISGTIAIVVVVEEKHRVDLFLLITTITTTTLTQDDGKTTTGKLRLAVVRGSEV